MEGAEMSEWTPEESRWMKRARKLFRDKPNTVRLYTTDGEITACKRGVPSNDLSEGIAENGIMACCYLNDHEDSFNMGHGHDH